jgi:hypothetical protein
VNYARWASREDFEAIFAHAETRLELEQFKAATSFARADANIYEIRAVVTA